MELSRIKEIVEKHTIPVFPSDVHPGEWAEAISNVLDLIDKEQENHYVDKKNPCEHAGVDYWYYPLTKEFYIALDEECSDKMFINYCPICGKKLPSYVFDIDVKEFED